MKTAYPDLKVVEFGPGPAVSYAGKLFSEMGATVVKIEPPGGDALRAHRTCYHGERESRANDWFSALNAGKQSMVVDVHAIADIEKLRVLLSTSSVLIHSDRDRGLSKQSLTPEQLSCEFPDLVVVAVTPYGLGDTWREVPADDLSIQSIGGICLGIGELGRAPLKLPGDQSAYQAGVAAAVAAAGQILSGNGALIDIAMADIWASFYNGGEIANHHFGRKRRPRAGYQVSRQPYVKAIFPCKDGYFAIQCLESRHWEAFLQMIGREDFASHPLFVSRAKANEQQADECNKLLEPWFRDYSKAEILALCLKNKIPGAPVYDMHDVVEHPHLKHRGYFSAITSPKGPITAPTHPYLGLGKDASCERHVPGIDEHAASVTSSPEQKPPRRLQPEHNRPLRGLRVVDFGWVWAGAIPGHILADMGADVIRIESKRPLDFMRQGRPIFGTDKDPEQNPVFQNVNRGKRSLCINMQEPGAAEVIKALVAKSDVVIENFSPGVMDRLGVGWKDLSVAKPDLIMCSMSAAGHSGPICNIRTYAVMIGALSGLNSLVGYPDEGVLAVQSPPYADPNAGIHAAFGILAALWRRGLTGEGVHIDLSQWEAAVNIMGEQVMDYTAGGHVPRVCGNLQVAHAPFNHYPVIGTDSWISISAADDVQWAAVVNALGRPGWTIKPEFSTAALRLLNRMELDVLMSAETAERDGLELSAKLRAAGVPSEKLLDIGDIAAHPYFQARQLFEMVPHPRLKSVPVYRLPWHMNGNPIPITQRAPFLGEHTVDVLTNLLHLAPSDIDCLREKRVID